jgi:hypothetical protein
MLLKKIKTSKEVRDFILEFSDGDKVNVPWASLEKIEKIKKKKEKLFLITMNFIEPARFTLDFKKRGGVISEKEPIEAPKKDLMGKDFDYYDFDLKLQTLFEDKPELTDKQMQDLIEIKNLLPLELGNGKVLIGVEEDDILDINALKVAITLIDKKGRTTSLFGNIESIFEDEIELVLDTPFQNEKKVKSLQFDLTFKSKNYHCEFEVSFMDKNKFHGNQYLYRFKAKKGQDEALKKLFDVLNAKQEEFNEFIRKATGND